MRIAAGDTAALNRLAQYMARCPFSLARLLRITPGGKVIYKADKEHCREYPLPAEDTLFGGVARNFQVFEPLDFLAELTQHIPNKGEHLIRYYGCYSNKARRMVNGVEAPPAGAPAVPLGSPPTLPDRLARRRWAMLIQRIYQIDPLVCPKCGGAMKIIAFIEARQDKVIRKILEHCGLWRDLPPRVPPAAPSKAVPGHRESNFADSVEVDPDFLEHLHREKQGEQLGMGWEF